MSNQNECECEYCKKILSSVSNLKVHQKTVKYCIKIQLEKKPELKQDNFNCKYCDKDFTKKSNLERHEFICNNVTIVYQEENKKLKEENQKLKEENQSYIIIKKKDDEIIVKQEEMICKLQDTIAKIAERPTTNTNNNNANTITKTTNKVVLNTLVMKTDDIKKAVDENYTRSLFLEGQRGVAEFFINYLNKDSEGKGIIRITDPSRGIIKYLDEQKNPVVDINGYKIISKIQDPIMRKAEEYLKEYLDDFNRLGMDRNATFDETELARLKCDTALDSKSDIKFMHTDSNEFTKELSKKLI